MVMWIVASRAASVVCDPGEARRILEDARIDEARAPVTHPWLVPGLARAADQGTGADPEMSRAITEICARGGDLSVERTDAWEDVGWAAYAVVIASAAREGCALVHHRVPVSIGIGTGPPRYRLRGLLPDERTPLQACGDAQGPSWRSETVVEGDRSAVRLVSIVDHVGDSETRHLIVRRASPEGWFDDVLVDPEPPRIADPTAAGPTVHLVPVGDGSRWVVMSHDRTEAPCRRKAGQVVWRWVGETWVRSEGREALGLLAKEGLWRYAGDDGWMLIVAQDDEGDLDLLVPRLRRLQRVIRDELFIVPSSNFPNLNPGFYLIITAPWSNERQARAARNRWDIPFAYVKRAWTAVDACASR